VIGPVSDKERLCHRNSHFIRAIDGLTIRSVSGNLAIASVRLGAGVNVQDVQLLVNQRSSSEVGVLIVGRVGTRWPVGTRELLVVDVTPNSAAAVVERLELTDTIVIREATDERAAPVKTEWVGGTIKVSEDQRLPVSPASLVFGAIKNGAEGALT